MSDDLIELVKRGAQPPQGYRQIYSTSLWKCLSAPYLALSFTPDQAVSCFLANYEHLSATLAADRLLGLYSADHQLWSDGRYQVTIKMEHVIPNEGELTLHFKDGSHTPLYGLSFSFVPGRVLSMSEPRVALLSRMQGRVGEAEKISRATKLCGDITPQAILYCAFQGIAQAGRASRTVGVSGSNHVCYRDSLSDVLHRAYDGFYSTVGGIDRGDGFYGLPEGLGARDLSEVAPWRRRRTKVKRAIKRELVAVACRSWSELQRG